VVEQIEHLRLQLQFFGFPDRKTAGQRNVDPLQPGTVERIQADSRRRPSAIDARRGVRGVFAEGGIVQVVIAGNGAIAERQVWTGAGAEQTGVRTAGRELHDAVQL
jgi:hypothetical protein